jgi:predicted Zn-dependent protease
VVFIERGVATGMCYDTSTAAAEHTQSTGHALTSNQSFGPIPMNLFLAPGDSSLERMIASTTKGLLVSKFHYANIAEPMKVVVTGMTRFGLFLVRDGKIAHPVKNMRFTQNVLEAFESASALTAERQMMEGLGGAMLVPGMKCESFRFTGKTEF